MKILYCDAYSGIAGDMFLAALLDAGLSLEYLQQELNKLNLPDHFEINKTEIHAGALRALRLKIKIHEHHHDHEHAEHHHHHHRHLSDILEIIQNSGISQQAKKTASAVFYKLAQAEAHVHGEPIEKVHFHEVGALDSIIDIIGAAIGLDYLGIERIYASPLPFSGGQVKTDHGLMPVPAPATLQILKEAHAPFRPVPGNGEMITPTGAAILAALATFEKPAFSITSVGIGAGYKEFEWPNILRVMIGSQENSEKPELVQIETNIDDMNPEFYGTVMQKLFEAGALDVFFTPIFMKKNRPATLLGVIAKKENEPLLANILLTQTSSFGVRVQPIYRYEAQREVRSVHTSYGDIPVKLKILDGKIIQAVPEYQDCAALADSHQIPVAKVYTAALSAGNQLLEE